MRRHLVLLVAIAAACTHWTEPRFGHLVVGPRTFQFEHGIELFRATNGLRVAVLPDKRSNLVTVDVRYLVGAADDPPDRTGMAHLVEHMTFLARATATGPTIADRMGDAALEFNAWTTDDETNYTSTALADHLGDVLDLEAARLAETCDQIDDATFARERDVVLEEETQRSGPFDSARDEILRAVWGEHHPYARPAGSHQVATATRDEACKFMASRYSPDRAILVVTGDVTVDEASAAIAQRFGPIASHDVRDRVEVAPAVLDGAMTHHHADVDAPTAMVFFPAPAWGADDTAAFELASMSLAHDLSAADDDSDWITGTSVDTVGGMRARVAVVSVTVRDAARLEDAVGEVYKAAASVGAATDFTTERWAYFHAERRRAVMSAWDSFLTRGAWIADYLAYTDHEWFFLEDMRALDDISSLQVARWAQANFIREHSHAALITASDDDTDGAPLQLAHAGEHQLEPWRTPVDVAEATHAITAATAPAPTAIADTLPNGLRVLYAPDPESPMVDARIVFPAGTAADPADHPGLAFETAEVIDPDYETIRGNDNIDRVRWALELGTALTVDVDETSTTFGARGLGLYADWHVWRLFFELDQGTFTSEAIDALRARVALAGDDETDPAVSALRERLFGKGHPYAAAPVTVADIKHIGKKDLEGFRRAHYRASGATLIISGGFDVDAMKTEVAEMFGAWSGYAPAPVPPVPAAHPADGPSWLGVRDDGVLQAEITIAFATSSDPEKDRPTRDVLEQLLQDRARVAREALGASYGVSVGYASGAGGGALFLHGEVDAEHAGDVTKALLAELTRASDPSTDLAADFVRARRRAFSIALASVAGASVTASELAFVAVHGVGLDYFAQLASRIGAVTPDDLRALIARDLDPKHMVISVRAPSDILTAALAAAGAPADVTVIDAE